MIWKSQYLNNLFKILPSVRGAYKRRNTDCTNNIPHFKIIFFEEFFFPINFN